MTHNEQDVERVAKAIHTDWFHPCDESWPCINDKHTEKMRSVARAALDAMGPREAVSREQLLAVIQDTVGYWGDLGTNEDLADAILALMPAAPEQKCDHGIELSALCTYAETCASEHQSPAAPVRTVTSVDSELRDLLGVFIRGLRSHVSGNGDYYAGIESASEAAADALEELLESTPAPEREVVSREQVIAWARKEFGVSNGTQTWVEFQGSAERLADEIASLLNGGSDE